MFILSSGPAGSMSSSNNTNEGDRKSPYSDNQEAHGQSSNGYCRKYAIERGKCMPVLELGFQVEDPWSLSDCSDSNESYV